MIDFTACEIVLAQVTSPHSSIIPSHFEFIPHWVNDYTFCLQLDYCAPPPLRLIFERGKERQSLENHFDTVFYYNKHRPFGTFFFSMMLPHPTKYYHCGALRASDQRLMMKDCERDKFSYLCKANRTEATILYSLPKSKTNKGRLRFMNGCIVPDFDTDFFIWLFVFGFFLCICLPVMFFVCFCISVCNCAVRSP